jgi:hypothetical protein
MTSAFLCRQSGHVSTDSTPPRVQELERKSGSNYRFPNSGSYNRDTSEGTHETLAHRRSDAGCAWGVG